MRRALALAITLLIVWLVVNWAVMSISPARRRSRSASRSSRRRWRADCSRRVGLPRVTGYLVFGMICGPYVLNIITRPMARELQLINGLAVVLIAFIAGLEMNFERMRPRLRAILQLSGVTMLVLYVGLFAGLWAGLAVAGDGRGHDAAAAVAVVALLTTILASFSPTVTIALIAESRAGGPLSELTLAVVILADLLLILFFTLVMQFVRYAFGGAGEVGLLVGLSWEIFGSFAFGAAVGALFAFYLRYVGREIPLALLAMCAIIAGLKNALHIEPLLAALAAGLVVENIARPAATA
jgi:Kef-type K+ transport system membrane component KefB